MLILTTAIFVLGLLLIILACLVREKQLISVFRGMDEKKLSDEEKAAFCKLSSAGLLTIGILMVISAMAAHFFKNPLCLLIALLGLIIGIVLIAKALKKYRK